MLRRKNNDLPYTQNQGNHSPYRFERKTLNLSPGLSPMRCRTPTRGNVSPFRNTGFNENQRGHSPIKFVSSKIVSPSTAGFFRQQNPSNVLGNHNQKYTPCVTNNDHSSRRQSYYDNENNSKYRGHNENSERVMIHQNTKLFSKLVSKLNSQKKKQPELVKRNTKPETYRPIQAFPFEHKSTGLEKQRTQPQSSKVEPIVDQIKPVESVVYEEKSIKSYSQKKTTVQNGREKQTFYQQQTYAIKEQTKTIPLKQIEQKNLQKNTNQDRSKSKNKTSQGKQIRYQNNKEESNKKKYESNKRQKYQIEHHYSTYENRINDFSKTMSQKSQLESQFDDVKMYLDKLGDSFGMFRVNKDDSISNISDTNNVNVSLMNMDPFI